LAITLVISTSVSLLPALPDGKTHLGLEEQLPLFPEYGTNFSARTLPNEPEVEMVLLQQMISAGLAIIFSIVIFFTSHRFIEARSAKHLIQDINATVLLEMSHQKFLP